MFTGMFTRLNLQCFKQDGFPDILDIHSVLCCQRWNLGPGYSLGVLESGDCGERSVETSVLSTRKWFLCTSWQQD